jgi:hypothetical protein
VGGLFVSMLLGCASVYVNKSLDERYTDCYLGKHTYILAARVIGTADEAAAYDHFYRRAQEIMLKKGYRKYEVMEMGSSAKRYSVHTRELIDTKLKAVQEPYVYSMIRFYKR